MPNRIPQTSVIPTRAGSFASSNYSAEWRNLLCRRRACPEQSLVGRTFPSDAFDFSFKAKPPSKENQRRRTGMSDPQGFAQGRLFGGKAGSSTPQNNSKKRMILLWSE